VTISFNVSVGMVCVGIWTYLFFFRGGFWRVWMFDDDREQVPVPQQFPAVVAIVPARNEAATIGLTVAALLNTFLSSCS